MALIFIRTAIIFITLLVVMRLMGKSQIGEMQPFEFIITLLIAELACIPMADTSIPLLYGIIAIVSIFILHEIVWLFNLWFKPFKAIVSGKPSVVINKQGIDEYQLKQNNLDVGDIIESMRGKGLFNLDDVYYGVYEANGSFSALEKENISSTALNLLIIDRGKIDKENVKKAGIGDGLKELLSSKKIKAEKVLAMTVNSDGRVYFQLKGKPYEILKIEVNNKW